jgi:alkylation response protein AidB-like acyl-CoA dehydrogenase
MMTEPDHILELRRQLSRFVLEKAPREKRRVWDQAHSFPRDLFAELAGMGLCGLTVPEEHGGSGVDIHAAVAAIEELCRAGSFLAGPFIQCAFYGGMNILENGSPEQKAQLLPRLARGELFFAYGLSEPDVGGDLSAVTTRARREGDEIIIDGAKRWCTGADFSDYIYCLVRSDPEAPARQGLSFVLIPTNAPGVTITPIDHVNLRYTLSSDVHFDGVRLPASAIVGGPEKWNRGWGMLAGRALDIEKLEISAVAFGLAQAAADAGRKQDGVHDGAQERRGPENTWRKPK